MSTETISPLVSVIVPTKNNIDTIEQCLTSIRAQTHPSIELIVVDNHSTDGTQNIARSLADRILTQGPERSAQRNAGLSDAKGTYILFVDSDMYLNADVVAACIQQMHATGSTCVFIPEDTIAKGFWGKCKKFERDFYKIGDASVEAARFFITKNIRMLGGYDETITAPEDWDMSDRYIAAYPPSTHITQTIVHDEGLVNIGAVFNKKTYYGDKGSSYKLPSHRRFMYPFRRSIALQWYRFVRHPVIGIGSIVLKGIESLGLLYGIYKNKSRTCKKTDFL